MRFIVLKQLHQYFITEHFNFEVKSIFNNVLEITVGYSIFNYPDSIAIIVFLDYKKTTFC